MIRVLQSFFFYALVWVASAGKADDFVDPMKHDLFLVTPKSFDSLINRHRNSEGVAVLLHFKSTDKQVKKFINEVYNEGAKEVKGMARFGAVDCAEWGSFCKDNLNPQLETPLLVVYPPNPVPAFVLKVG